MSWEWLTIGIVIGLVLGTLVLLGVAGIMSAADRQDAESRARWLVHLHHPSDDAACSICEKFDQAYPNL